MKKVKVVAISLAFALVLIAVAAPPVAAASRYDSLTSYMADNYDAVRGGYKLPFDGVTRVNPTYGAISIMDEVGVLAQRPPPISVPNALEFSSNIQWLTGDENEEPYYGGFSDYLLGPVTTATNYHGLRLWQILKNEGGIPGTDEFDINQTANAFWINKTSDSGGFGSASEVYPDLVSTYYALASLRIIDQLYPLENAWDTYVNESATIEWIESCRDGDAYMLSPISDRASVTATTAAVLAYYAINPVTLVPGASSVQTWLLNRQVLEYQEPEFVGGFEEGNATKDPNLVSTYFALSALDTLNAIPSVNATAAESFILNTQSTEGSWGLVPGVSKGSLLYSAYACQALNMLPFEGAFSTLSSSVDPNSQGSSSFDWRIAVVLGIIVVAMVISAYALRMD